MTRRRRLLATAAAGALALGLALAAWAAFAPLPGSSDLTYVIPPGTADRQAEGRPLDVLPAVIRLMVGVRDVLVLSNDDTAIHQLGPIILGPRQIYRIPFRQPGQFRFTCSLHASGSLAIVVEAPPRAGLDRLRWRVARLAAA